RFQRNPRVHAGEDPPSRIRYAHRDLCGPGLTVDQGVDRLDPANELLPRECGEGDPGPPPRIEEAHLALQDLDLDLDRIQGGHGHELVPGPDPLAGHHLHARDPTGERRGDPDVVELQFRAGQRDLRRVQAALRARHPVPLRAQFRVLHPVIEEGQLPIRRLRTPQVRFRIRELQLEIRGVQLHELLPGGYRIAVPNRDLTDPARDLCDQNRVL